MNNCGYSRQLVGFAEFEIRQKKRLYNKVRQIIN